MAEENKKPKTDYGSNSAKSRGGGPEVPDRPRVQQIVSATTRKKGVGTKLKETFVGDSAESVGQYIFFDIIVPRVKDLLYEMISGGSERALFGTSTRASRSRSQLVARTDYKGISSKLTDRPAEREISARGRATHNFEEVLIPTRGEAEQVLDTLIALVDQYESATVADFYSACGISADHTDLKFGWKSLDDARIEPARGGGYIIDFPKTVDL